MKLPGDEGRVIIIVISFDDVIRNSLVQVT